MKKYISVIIILFTLTISCSVENPQDNSNNKIAVDAIKESYKDSERLVEVFLTEANVLYVSIIDNGVDQNRFAETICNQLKEYNSTIKWVKIVKAGSTEDKNADNAYGVLLGDCHCQN